MVKNIFSIFILISQIILCNSSQQIKMYIFYTPSHQKMYEEWFLPSIHPDDNYEIIAEIHNQECPSGTFMKTGWIETMKRKVDLIIRAINENWGEIFIHSDVDIQFFGPTQSIITKLMGGKDLIAQYNDPSGDICAGFFACRANKKTLRLWQAIRRNISFKYNDQILLNYYLRHKNHYNINWDYLPTDKFLGGGTFTGKVWKSGESLPIPQDILMYHANYVVGIENKIEQLEYVKSIVAFNNIL